MNWSDESEERPEWIDMVPVKRYEHFTLFHKYTPSGSGYYKCFMNTDIDKYKKGVASDNNS